MKSIVRAHRYLVREFMIYNNKKNIYTYIEVNSITEFGQSLRLVFLLTEKTRYNDSKN